MDCQTTVAATTAELRRQIARFLRFDARDSYVSYETHEVVAELGYRRLHISYPAPDGDEIPAFLLVPDGDVPFAAVLVHHQHHGERHLGKSEVGGLAGDPLQAFGPALARQGIVVLAPDSICFEDRRANTTGLEPDPEADVSQHYNEMCYRLVRGDTLMRKVLSDSAQAISLLRSMPSIDPERIGIMGHSYGGTTSLFHAALDERLRFVCSSGAACTYRRRMAQGTGIEMSSVIPGFAEHYDLPDLARCLAPRAALLVSATDDKHSQDANAIAAAAREAYVVLGAAGRLEHLHYDGGHALTEERFDAIVSWVAGQATAPPM